jgi:predicted DNA-binding ribbon-helix-helix protein
MARERKVSLNWLINELFEKTTGLGFLASSYVV